MKLYPKLLKFQAIYLRKKGKTSQEINIILGQKIPKSTYTGWFKGIELTKEQKSRISIMNLNKLDLARVKAVKVNKEKRNKFLKSLDEKNEPISKKIKDGNTAKIALAMLCLGEASKYGSGSAFCLGSSDPRIIILFIKLLKKSYLINQNKFRYTIQCRADQDIEELEKYWRRIVRVPLGQFYKTRIDARSIGKPTKKVGYKGVLKVDYMDTKVQLELESLASMIYNQFC
ncbi:TPA: hypothetical protein DCP77_03435 [Candidatus Collierbacteria bacterium]|uniref:Uncharacterized protein n=1 Tax=Candidatus Collierbacteria bacterium GW2011_GWA2_42_17 TaxID=1618378 RepID=A0A0G0Z3B1_9BACT|nr:MAG: hypothetical protein UU94_C0008G0039 [Candidatus Collierbacteria bacterium GW2011_GWB2_42_12]KKS43244.1 MAG: hypothetical protein UV06_C0002G0146 [Candidatus Collierbacteria bacterium GW2011_GWA2_42_17]KKS62201.1 MAG: hypothetical protein UV30_C0021G0006 [Candidatus Collierbacteria bacterium GW2011_GWF1_42_50]KKS62224.1 MAG: hypothetical protein UV29_C0020G0011 [Candidatus Collierbacteria bacterium GW2011_GWD2_42_50]KKS64206.1 MAG: hypothetical protein UV32_C0021G0003 [Candidatus Collie